MKHPHDPSSPGNLSFAARPGVNPALAPGGARTWLLKRAIVDMKAKDNSYHEITGHFAAVYSIKVTKADVAAAILEAGGRARHLNGIYDRLALQQVQVLEVDEIFQGRQNCYLGAADKSARYLFLLEPLGGRSSADIAPLLVPLAAGADVLEVVVTDLLRAYRGAIPAALGDVAHLACHVHACRRVREHLDACNRGAREAWKAWKRKKEQVVAAKAALRRKRRQLRRLEGQLARLVEERDTYYQAAGIRPRARGQPWTPARQALKTRLGALRARVRSKQQTVSRAEARVEARQTAASAAEDDYWEAKQASLQAGRLVRRLKDFLACPPGELEASWARLEGMLRRSPLKIARKILRLLRDHPHLLAAKTAALATLCPPNQSNTNNIEGIFGLVRPLLDKARHFPDSPVGRALLAIWRLRHNLSRPTTGPRTGTSPLERCGVRPGFATYLDALFPPPPQGDCLAMVLLGPWFHPPPPAREGRVTPGGIPPPASFAGRKCLMEGAPA